MQDYYQGIAGIYFWTILKRIVKVGELKNKKVLDFGCGLKKLKTLLPNAIGYDIDPALTEVTDWKTQDFEVVVASQVFYEMDKNSVVQFLRELYQVSPKATLIFTISRYNWLNRLGAKLLNKTAHDKYKIYPGEEMELLGPRITVIKTRGVFFLCDIYVAKLTPLNAQ